MAGTPEALKLPFDDAISFFRQKANVTSEKWTDVWREAHSRGFTVAGTTSEALLADFRAAIDKAISAGTTLAEFRKDFDTIVAKHGWSYNGTPGWRSRVIYETNLATAYSAGRYAQATDPDVLRVFPYWMYRHGGSACPRLQHLALDGLVLRADDPFWASHYPPNGWRCSCYTVSVSESGLRGMGKSGPDQSPTITYRDWRNPNTGEIHRVPNGIDPGFDYNPGMAWKQGAPQPTRAPRLRADAVQPPPAPAASDAQLAAWVAQPAGPLALGGLSDDAAEAVSARGRDVSLAPDTWAEIQLGLGEDAARALGDVRFLIAQPDQVKRIDALTVLLFGRGLAATIEAAGNRTENFLVRLLAGEAAKRAAP
jgi:hypothetical protein